MTEKAYLDNWYGRCKFDPCPCQCSKKPWRGILCPNWQPDGDESFAARLARLKKERNEAKK